MTSYLEGNGGCLSEVRILTSWIHENLGKSAFVKLKKKEYGVTF